MQLTSTSNSDLEQVRNFFIGSRKIGDLTVTKEFLHHSDGFHKTYWQSVFGPRPARASVLIIHGFGEYVGRYTRVACELAANDYEVHLFDFSGFGYSSGRRFMASYEHLQHDFHLVLKKLRKDLPLFILAHSMGGGFILSYLLSNPSFKAAGVIFYCPWVGFSPSLPMAALDRFVIRQLPHTLDVT
jgi:alpha-beta hydrolase superfamily lysophospholipase